MRFALLADVVLVAHVAFVLFAALGGLLAMRWRRAAWAHLPAAAWGVLIELTGGVCPLTPLENRLKQAAGASGYEGGFVEHYIAALLYPDALSRHLQFALAAFLAALNVAVYALVLWRRGRR
jgi:hypothetical protein